MPATVIVYSTFRLIIFDSIGVTFSFFSLIRLFSSGEFGRVSLNDYLPMLRRDIEDLRARQ